MVKTLGIGHKSLNTEEPSLDIYDNEHCSKSEKGRPTALKAIVLSDVSYKRRLC